MSQGILSDMEDDPMFAGVESIPTDGVFLDSTTCDSIRIVADRGRLVPVNRVRVEVGVGIFSLTKLAWKRMMADQSLDRMERSYGTMEWWGCRANKNKRKGDRMKVEEVFQRATKNQGRFDLPLLRAAVAVATAAATSACKKNRRPCPVQVTPNLAQRRKLVNTSLR